MSNVQNNFEGSPKKKWFQKWWIWVIVAIIFIIAMASGGGDTTTKETSKSVSSTQQAENKKDKPKATQKPAATTAPKNEVLGFFIGNQNNEAFAYTITDKAKEFLGSNAILFPTKSESAVAPYTDTSIGYKHLAKSISNYGDKLMYIAQAGVVEIAEEKVDGKAMTLINVMDETENQLIVYYIGSLSDVFEGDYISIYGLPLGMSSFKNTDGGTTIVGVLAGSYVKKIQ